MADFWQVLSHHQIWLWWIGGGSAAVFVVGFLLLPVVVIALPSGFFRKFSESDRARKQNHPVLAAGIFLGRNVLGALFVLAGIVMLVLPGQGLLSIVLGGILMDFPRKRKLLRALLRKQRVQAPLNWLRRRARRPPLQFP